jgi:mannose-1-phosphate guanylyltransferase
MGAKTSGVVLAGQYTWRDSRFDRLSPRPLLPVANRPLFSYAVDWLKAGGLEEITLGVNAETTRDVAAALADQSGAPGLRLHADRTARGPAGSLRDATIDTDAETVVVVDGTSVPAADLGPLLACHHAEDAAATVLVHPEPGQSASCGRYLPGGVYVVSRRAVELVHPRGFQDIKEGLLPRLYRSGERTAAYVAGDSSPRALDAPSYLALNDWVLERLAALPPVDGYRAHGSAQCHDSARVSPDAVFVGPVRIGPGAQVLGDATLVGPTSVGPHSLIGPGALVSRCAVWRGSSVGEDSVADRCILPDGSVLGAREWALGQVLEPAPGGRRAAAAAERRSRASIFGFRPDILLSK